MTVVRALDVSTGCLTMEDLGILEELSRDTSRGDPTGYNGPRVARHAHGYVLHLCNDKESQLASAVGAARAGLSDRFVDLLKVAFLERCMLVNLDSDGPGHPGLWTGDT